MIVILGGLFLLVAVVALYILIDKKVIANPFTYLFPSTPSSLGSLDSPESLGPRESMGSTDSDTPSDDMPSTYIDSLSPDKKIKGRYIKVAQTVINTDAAKTIWCDAFRCGQYTDGGYLNNIYTHVFPSKPIQLTSIRVYDRNGDPMSLDTANNFSEAVSSSNSPDNLFDTDIDDEGNQVYTEFTTNTSETTPSTQTVPDYLLIDLKKEMTISEISLEAKNTSRFVDYNMVGVYVEIQRESRKPIARTPIITIPGRIFNFKFPGTSWDIEEATDLKFE